MTVLISGLHWQKSFQSLTALSELLFFQLSTDMNWLSRIRADSEHVIVWPPSSKEDQRQVWIWYFVVLNLRSIVLLSEAYGTACSITWWTFRQQVKCITGNWKGWIQNLLVDPCGLSDFPQSAQIDCTIRTIPWLEVRRPSTHYTRITIRHFRKMSPYSSGR